MHWKVKGVVQKILSGTPGGMTIDHALQRVVGGLRHLEPAILDKVEDWVVHVDHMAKFNVRTGDLTYLEIGTGVMPVLPICFYLCGAKACYTYDVVKQVSPNLTFRVLEALESQLSKLARCAHADESAVTARYTTIRKARDIPELFELANIFYRAPGDACASNLAGESVDVIYSNSVLEHVETSVVPLLMAETARVLRPGGLALHSVNCGDHYAYFDSSITPINYLTYSEAQWRFWNNGIQYQNRLRPQDFIEAARGAGLKVLLEYPKPKQHLLRMLPKLKIAPEFNKYSPEQLCSTNIDMVLQKP